MGAVEEEAVSVDHPQPGQVVELRVAIRHRGDQAPGQPIEQPQGQHAAREPHLEPARHSEAHVGDEQGLCEQPGSGED